AVHEGLEQREANRIARTVAAAAVHRNEQPDAGIEHQIQVAMKPARISRVTDDPPAIAVLFIESKRHTVQVRGGHYRVCARMHPLHRIRIQDTGSLQLATVQMSDHETAHVRACRAEAARWPGLSDLERTRLAVRCQL